jgi:hypothetical protein
LSVSTRYASATSPVAMQPWPPPCDFGIINLHVSLLQVPIIINQCASTQYTLVVLVALSHSPMFFVACVSSQH